MPSCLLSNLNRAVTVNLYRRINLISQKKTTFSCKLLKYSTKNCSTRTMAATGSITGSGDIVVDKVVSNCASFSGFVKPGGVFFGDKSYRNCVLAKVSLRNGVDDGNVGVGVGVVFGNERKKSCFSSSTLLLNGRIDFRTFSSVLDGGKSEVSVEESLNVGKLSSIALSDDKTQSFNHLKLNSGVCYMPHPDKEETGGEDAYFICVDEQVIGVADGVGGWADVGVNAGLYARELMSNSVKAIQQAPNIEVDPLRVLEKAHSQTKAMGSSTACIIALKKEYLHAINLGDSGFIVVRDGSIIFESPVQQHGFNFTYQLENSERGDQPSSGQVFEIPVIPGDVVVAGSDGLYDNLYGKEVASIVGDSVKEGLSPNEMAQKIATVARVRALDRKCRSPFAIAAQEAGYTFYGGKLDDLTVLVSYISTSTDA